MKITVHNENKDFEKNYPYLGIHEADLTRTDPLIVLFVKDGFGIRIHSNTVNAAGEPTVQNLLFTGLTEAWVEQVFVPYNGSVVLQN